MNKLYFLIFLFLVSLNVFGINNSVISNIKPFEDSTTRKYYICLSGINSHKNINEILNNIKNKEGVIQFLNGGPIDYFYLKSNKQIGEKEFQSWIGVKYKLVVFGETDNDLKKALSLSRRGEIRNF